MAKGQQTATQPFAFNAMVEALGSVPSSGIPGSYEHLPQGMTISRNYPFYANKQELVISESEIQRMELLCQQVYTSSDPVERSKAEREIMEFATSPNCLKISALLLDRANSPYSQLIGAQTLVKVVTTKPNNLTSHQKIELRNYAIQYLVDKVDSASFVIQSLTKLFAVVTKSLWFDETQDFLPFIHSYFISHTNHLERQTIGTILLNQLIQEINQTHNDPLIHRSITRQRRVATEFRDKNLMDIYVMTCSILKTNLPRLEHERSCISSALSKLIECSLKLINSCLSYDFIGTSPDESNSDDLPTVQIPSSWRKLFIEEDIVEVLFALYHLLPSELGKYAISCLVQVTSVRRSLFNSNERFNFLVKILNGIEGIIIDFDRLSDPDSYHEFSRLLVRFKSNFQLSELCKAPKFDNWLVLVRDMTIHSFKQFISPNSTHYLLMFWQKLVSSSNYCKGTFDKYLDEHAPKIFRSYVQNRLDCVNAVATDASLALEDPLDDLIMIQQQMEHLAHLSRQNFRETARFLAETFEKVAHRYTELIQMSEYPETDFQIITGHLAWLVYVVGATIHGRIFVTNDNEDPLEGELVSLVMQLSQVSDAQLRQNRLRCERLELAFLSFFDIYRKCHMCELGGGRIHKRLVEILNLDNESHLFSVYITKIITNLNCWSSSEPVIKHTLEMFSELSQGFSNMHKLYELKEIKFMLTNHNAQNFPFLSNSASMEFMRHRTSFFASLTKHLIESMRFSHEDSFDEFLLPIDRALDELNKLLIDENYSEDNYAKNETAKRAFIGTCRDVRGVAKEFIRPNIYNLLFEWLFPKYTALLRTSLEVWYNDPNATTPALRLIAELVDTREKRAYNDYLTTDALYLFIEVSKILIGYGTKLLSITDIPYDQLYVYKLKPISLLFKIIQLLLKSRVNYAVFQLYGDPSLRNVLEMFVKLFVSILNCDILSYPKLSFQYFPLLEILAANHCEFLSNIEPDIFRCILISLHSGISVSEDRICTSSLISINYILTQNFKWYTKQPRRIGSQHRVKEDEERRELSRRVLETHKEQFQSMMVTMLELLMSSEQVSHPQLPLPLLVIILLYDEKFTQIRRNLIKAQKTSEAERSVSGWFDTLMDGICFSVSQSNRDK